MKRIRILAGVVAAALAAVMFAVPVTPAFSQAAGSIYSQNPMTRDVGVGSTLKVLNFTAAAASSTVVSQDFSGFNVSRIICVFNQTAHTSSPSTTMSIHNKDAASGTYYTMITNVAVTADASPTAIALGAGVATNANLGLGMPVAAKWRVILTIGGSGTTTGTVGCSVQ